MRSYRLDTVFGRLIRHDDAHSRLRNCYFEPAGISASRLTLSFGGPR